MKLFNLSMSTLMLRFYLMMAIILIAGYGGIWPLAFFALPVFLSALLGVEISFLRKAEYKSEHIPGKQHQMKQRPAHAQHAA